MKQIIPKLAAKTTLIISQCLWVRNLGLALLVASGSGSHTRLQSRHWPWPVVSFEGSARVGSASKLTHVIVRRIQFLSDCCPETSVPCHVDHFLRQLTAHNREAGFLQSEQGRETDRESERQREKCSESKPSKSQIFVA